MNQPDPHPPRSPATPAAGDAARPADRPPIAADPLRLAGATHPTAAGPGAGESSDTPAALFVRTTSDTAELAIVRRQVEAFCHAQGFDDRAVGEIGLCVNEAMANIIRHAYRGRSGEPIEVTATLVESTLRVSLRDWGEGSPPPGALPKEKSDPFEPGGLGLICLGRLLDRVTFTPQRDGGMLLELVRRRHAAASGT